MVQWVILGCDLSNLLKAEMIEDAYNVFATDDK